ncbi:MAG: hypothetical protein WDK96_00660 [Candidatus Paceibacterota bacterium]|jgi:hypothetical protein
MSKQKIILILGFWILILPFLGLTTSWKKFFLMITGISLMYLAYLIHKEKLTLMPKKEEKYNTFTDNRHEIKKKAVEGIYQNNLNDTKE